MKTTNITAMQILSLLSVKLKNKSEELEKYEKVGEFNKLDSNFQMQFLIKQAEYSEIKKIHDEIEALIKEGIINEK